MHERRLGVPPLAVVTAVSSGVAFELARQCARHGFDLFVAAEDATVPDLGARLRVHGTAVQTARADLAEPEGVQRLLHLLGSRPVHALVAHAGHGLDRVLNGSRPAPRRARPDPFVKAYLRGTVELIQAVARRMHAGGAGRVLLLGPTCQERAGSLQALCRGTRQFIGGFADAFREEVADGGLTVTCGMPPGPQAMEPPTAWAGAAFQAMMRGEPEVRFFVRHPGVAWAAAP